MHKKKVRTDQMLIPLLLLSFFLIVSFGCVLGNNPEPKEVTFIPQIGISDFSSRGLPYISDTNETGDVSEAESFYYFFAPILLGFKANTAAVEVGDVYENEYFGETLTISVSETEEEIIFTGEFNTNEGYFKLMYNPTVSTFSYMHLIEFTTEAGNIITYCLIPPGSTIDTDNLSAHAHFFGSYTYPETPGIIGGGGEFYVDSDKCGYVGYDFMENNVDPIQGIGEEQRGSLFADIEQLFQDGSFNPNDLSHPRFNPYYWVLFDKNTIAYGNSCESASTYEDIEPAADNYFKFDLTSEFEDSIPWSLFPADNYNRELFQGENFLM